MTATYTTVPEVRAALFDTILPAALANLPTTITVAGQNVDLRAPELYYGTPDTKTPPSAWLGIGASTAEDINAAVFPISQLRPFDEQYDLDLGIWYRIGDADAAAQRVSTESAWAVYRAIAAELRTTTAWATVLQSPFSVLLTKVTDTEYPLGEGRAVAIKFTLTIKSRV